MEQDVNIIYNVYHEPSLGFPIAMYFYLTGLSAGSFLLSTLAYGFGMEKYKPIGFLGVGMAVVLLVLAPLNLIIDLEQPMRFWHLIPYLAHHVGDIPLDPLPDQRAHLRVFYAQGTV